MMRRITRFATSVQCSHAGSGMEMLLRISRLPKTDNPDDVMRSVFATAYDVP